MRAAHTRRKPRLNRKKIAKCGFTCEIALLDAADVVHPVLKQPSLELAARCSAVAFQFATQHAQRLATYNAKTKATP